VFRVAGAPAVWPCEEAGRVAPDEVELDVEPVGPCGRVVDREAYEDVEDDAAPLRRPLLREACAELFRKRERMNPAAIAPPKNMRGLRRA